MPDRAQTVWVRLKKNGRIDAIHPEPFSGFKKIRIHYHAPNKRGMGRSKGNAHENATAKAFSLWIYGKKKYLKRTPLSGGWASGKAGDVILDHEISRKKNLKDPPIYVECRSYKDILQHDVLTWVYYRKPSVFTNWVREVEKKCDGRLPFLVMKGTRTKEWILISRDWLTENTWMYVRDVSKLRATINSETFYLFPLERLVSRLGEGRGFLKTWREDGGSHLIRRYCGNTE